MSKRHRNKTEQGTTAAVASQMDSFQRYVDQEIVKYRCSPVFPALAHGADRSSAWVYELYEQRGREDGHAHDDWLHAEAEVVGTASRSARVG